MKRTCKRLTALVLALSMCLSLLSATAWAAGDTVEETAAVSAQAVTASGTCGDDLTWMLTEDGTVTISGTGEMENYSAGRHLYQSGYVYYSFAPWGDYRESITAVVIDTGVTKIGEYAFYGCSVLTSVCISDSVLEIDTYAFGCCANLNDVALGNGLTKIGETAFFECTCLDAITIPDSVTSIGHRAFMYCSGLASVSIGNAVTSIDGYAFYECESLVNIVIPDNVTSISEFVFTGCTSLESITIGSGVTKIGGSYGEYSAFTDCSALTSIIVSTDNPTYSSIDGVLFDKEQTQLIKYPAGNLRTSYVVPDTVTVIGRYAFSYCYNLINIIIGGGVTSIKNYAFAVCTSLTDVYYAGSADNWAAIDIGSYNTYLTDATIHYNSTGPDEEDGEDTYTDYTWVFGQDNFSFLNSKGSFGSGEYYIEDEMFYSYLKTLTETQIKRIAAWYGSYSLLKTYRSEFAVRLENFLKNKLIDFDGSCYGMSLVSTLIKTGNLSAEELGAATTYELGPLNKDENTELESIINLYHISQMVDTAVGGADIGDEDFAEKMEYIWDVATAIGDEEQPFLMSLQSENGGHAVVCYGAETGDFSTGSLWWKDEYDKRLLIYNPNSDKADYIYISEDFSKAELDSDSVLTGFYTGFYLRFGLTDEGTWNTFSEYLDIPHYVYLDVDNQSLSNYTINASDGSYATISDGSVTDGTLDVSVDWVAGELADGEESENSFYTVYLPDTSDYYTLSSTNGETLDALLTYDDFSVSINGTFDSATIYSNETVDIQDGEGDLAVTITINDSDFDYVSITGEIDGDVSFQVKDDNIYITGDLSNYIVENMDNNCETSTVYVEEDADVQALMEKDSVTLYEDTDGDGVYETKLSHTHYYVYQDNGDGTHTATCIGDDDSYTEAHTYENEVCTLCGAEQTDLTTCTLTLSTSTYTYDGTAKTPAVTVTDAEGNTLTEGMDYTVSYSDNTAVGTATVTVTGIGSYTGTATATFTIEEATQEPSGDQDDTGDTSGDTSGDQSGSDEETAPAATKITSAINRAKGVKLTWNAVDGATNYQVYRKIGSGSWKKVKTTSATTWLDTAAMKNGTKYQYKVYAVNSAGTSKASTTKTIYRLTAKHFTRAKNVKGKKISLKWTRNTKATGYIIQYSTSKSFTGSTTKTVKIKGNKNLTTTLKNLKKGKTYYIRMRPYKTSGGVTSYAGWSKVKTVKVKK